MSIQVATLFESRSSSGLAAAGAAILLAGASAGCGGESAPKERAGGSDAAVGERGDQSPKLGPLAALSALGGGEVSAAIGGDAGERADAAMGDLGRAAGDRLGDFALTYYVTAREPAPRARAGASTTGRGESAPAAAEDPAFGDEDGAARAGPLVEESAYADREADAPVVENVEAERERGGGDAEAERERGGGDAEADREADALVVESAEAERERGGGDAEVERERGGGDAEVERERGGGDAEAEPRRVPIRDDACDVLAEVDPDFLADLRMQGSGILQDDRLVTASRSCECDPGGVCFAVAGEGVEWGVGAAGRELAPFRSVAVDSDVIPLGATLYVRELDGLTMPGDPPWGGFVHDGCVVADDRGGAVRGAHLDFFAARRGYYEALLHAHGLTRVTVYDGSERCGDDPEATRRPRS